MRIQTIEANNFKSLVNFRLELAKFSCLVGLNGVGKSTVLQFIDFLAQQARGEISEWLEGRNWKHRDILFRLKPAKTVTFTVNVVDPKQREVTWAGTFNPYRLYCTAEKLTAHDAELIVHGGVYTIKDRNPDKNARKKAVSEAIQFMYQGSILSQLRDEALPESLLAFKRFLLQTESLDMLTPERLRQRTRDAHGSLGHGGRHLSAFVYELGVPGRKALAAKLKDAYPRLHHVYAKSLQSGWKQLQASEMFGKKKMWTEARHLNDGLLRLIAIFSELASEHTFLLFDEIENGVNPELIEFVTDALVKAKQQVLVTTHSPMILNFLDDDTAKHGVIYLYKNRDGQTRSIPFFSIPSLKEKLKFMGPGEAFVDTNLVELADEIAQNGRKV